MLAGGADRGHRLAHVICCSVKALAEAAPHLSCLTRLELEHGNVEGLDVAALPAL